MFEIVDSKYILVNSDYFIFAKQIRRFVKVDGKKIVIKGFEDFEFFFYKHKEEIIICEAFTGTKVSVDAEGTFVNVLRSTSETLNDVGKLRLKKTFRLMMKITKLSPRYRYICNPLRK